MGTEIDIDVYCHLSVEKFVCRMSIIYHMRKAGYEIVCIPGIMMDMFALVCIYLHAPKALRRHAMVLAGLKPG